MFSYKQNVSFKKKKKLMQLKPKNQEDTVLIFFLCKKKFRYFFELYKENSKVATQNFMVPIRIFIINYFSAVCLVMSEL